MAAQPTRRPEIPITAKQWDGLITAPSSRSIPLSAQTIALNMVFEDQFKYRSRRGSVEYMSNAVTGSGVTVLDGIEYRKSGTNQSKIVFATSDGKLYWKYKGNSSPTLIGTMLNTVNPTVSMVIMKDSVYIADGVGAYKYDNDTLSTITTFPTVSYSTRNIVRVSSVNSQLVWADDNDYLYLSVPNNPDDLTTEANGAWKGQVQYGDGARITGLLRWGDTLLITKADNERKHLVLYWLQGLGTTNSPYSITALFGDEKSPTGFVGRSAVQGIRGDVIALTPQGFVSVTGINTFREAAPAIISDGIADIIKRINFNAPDAINAVYDSVNQRYLCSVPLDYAAKMTHTLCLDLINNRWTLWDNWDVACWVRIDDNIIFGTNNGRFVKINTTDSDEGAGFTKKISTGDIDLDSPDVIKVFKSVEYLLRYEGNYSIYMNFYIDNRLANSSPIAMTKTGVVSMWNVFYWNRDSWGIPSTDVVNVLLMARGKTIRIEVYNTQAAQPFSLESLTLRSLVKDHGQAKV